MSAAKKKVDIKALFTALDLVKYEIAQDNIPLFLNHLRSHLKAILNDPFTIEFYRPDNFIFDKDGYAFYQIKITCEEIKTYSYHNLMNGPLKNLYEMDGVIDLHFLDYNTNVVKIIYPIDFFLDNDMFRSLKAINKFDL